MPNRRKRHNPPLELRIVLDTNAIFTKSYTDFLNYNFSQFIKENLGQDNLTLQWYLPEVVRHERQYRMIEQAKALISSAKKLEWFFGREFKTDDAAIKNRADEIIDEALTEHKIQTIKLNPSKVDWNDMMLKAAYRLPPFEAGDTEKGFRDALIAECFMQLLDESPTNPHSCRVILITGDGLLTKAINGRIGTRENVHLYSTINELQGLINTLISNIGEEIIKRIQQEASNFFFRQGVEDTLFYREKISSEIEQKFGDRLLELPEGTTKRVNGGWMIAPPQFLKQEGERITWVSQVALGHTAYKAIPASFGLVTGSYPVASSTAFTLGTSPIYSTGSTSTSLEQISSYSDQPFSGSYSASYHPPEWSTYEVLAAIGSTTFEVEWSVVVRDRDNFDDPKIEDIRLSQVVWN